MDEPGKWEPAVRADDERRYVEFWPAGVGAAGWFLCTGCGNTVIVRQVLPRCGMCGGRLWERAQLTSAASRAL